MTQHCAQKRTQKSAPVHLLYWEHRRLLPSEAARYPGSATNPEHRRQCPRSPRNRLPLLGLLAVGDLVPATEGPSARCQGTFRSIVCSNNWLPGRPGPLQQLLSPQKTPLLSLPAVCHVACQRLSIFPITADGLRRVPGAPLTASGCCRRVLLLPGGTLMSCSGAFIVRMVLQEHISTQETIRSDPRQWLSRFRIPDWPTMAFRLHKVCDCVQTSHGEVRSSLRTEFAQAVFARVRYAAAMSISRWFISTFMIAREKITTGSAIWFDPVRPFSRLQQNRRGNGTSWAKNSRITTHKCWKCWAKS